METLIAEELYDLVLSITLILWDCMALPIQVFIFNETIAIIKKTRLRR